MLPVTSLHTSLPSANDNAATFRLDPITFFVFFSSSVDGDVLSSDSLDFVSFDREDLRRVVVWVDETACLCSSRCLFAVRLVLYTKSPSSSSESSYQVIASKDFIIPREEDLVVC